MSFEHPSVSKIVNDIKNLLEGQFRNISFVGEVTNLSSSSTGHWYFTLSDSDASISAALFKMDAFRNPIIKNLKDGDKVLVSGGVGVYSKRGTFQVIVKRITPVGKGDLKEQFERLKRKLQSEGLFDQESKKRIPTYPKRVAVITAEGAAALQDFLNIVERRSLWMDVTLVPSLVQGDTAPASLRKALEKAIRFSISERQKENGRPYDVIVLTRGGGSLEDLWAFNDEALAWDIYNCPIPIISAVGHQVDFSISDYVADFRAETPSAAAEVLTNSQMKIKEKLTYAKRGLDSISRNLIPSKAHDLNNANPRELLDKIRTHFQSYSKRLERCNLQHRVLELTNIHEHNLRLDELIEKLENSNKSNLVEYQNKVEKLGELLRVLNPNNVLDRGFSYIQSESGTVISKTDEFDELSLGDKLNVHFSDGVRTVEKSE